jgi:hypothetical protein
MRPLIGLLFSAHIVLLLLAATEFTLITWFRDRNFTINAFAYSFQSGWGYEYRSNYSFAIVATYLAAYVAGLVVFWHALHQRSWLIGGLGAILCSLGVISFAVEGSHWIMTHNRSFIVSFPIVMAVLWICLLGRWVINRRAAAASRVSS